MQDNRQEILSETLGAYLAQLQDDITNTDDGSGFGNGWPEINEEIRVVKQLLKVDFNSLFGFVGTIARMTCDGEVNEEGQEFVMENDDAVSTLNELIHEARELGINQ